MLYLGTCCSHSGVIMLCFQIDVPGFVAKLLQDSMVTVRREYSILALHRAELAVRSSCLPA